MSKKKNCSNTILQVLQERMNKGERKREFIDTLILYKMQ